LINSRRTYINRRSGEINNLLNYLEGQLQQVQANIHQYQQEIDKVNPPIPDSRQKRREIRELVKRQGELETTIKNAENKIKEFGDNPRFAHLKKREIDKKAEAEKELTQVKKDLEKYQPPKPEEGKEKERNKEIANLQKALSAEQEEEQRLSKIKGKLTGELNQLTANTPEQ